MKILVTGAVGMLGTAMCPTLLNLGHKVYMTDINRTDKNIHFLDVRDKEKVFAVFGEIKPDLVMHLAAETDVDKCEIEIDHAYLINTIGTENIALACQFYNSIMVYISTAGVFDGKKKEPYTEFDEPNPINVYGKTKLEGEKIVRSLLSKYFIIRAGWMIGGGKKDKKFVAKIIELLKTKKEISVVTDKVGSPTYTKDFSKNIMPLIETKRYGLYHMTNKGRCSRYDIAKKIVEFMNIRDVAIKPILSNSFPLPAPRADSEMMRNYKLDLLGMNNMRHWEDALKEYINTTFLNE